MAIVLNGSSLEDDGMFGTKTDGNLTVEEIKYQAMMDKVPAPIPTAAEPPISADLRHHKS